jgi:hypothetical protein
LVIILAYTGYAIKCLGCNIGLLLVTWFPAVHSMHKQINENKQQRGIQQNIQQKG